MLLLPAQQQVQVQQLLAHQPQMHMAAAVLTLQQ
jgi:hypothetical protein